METFAFIMYLSGKIEQPIYVPLVFKGLKFILGSLKFIFGGKGVLSLMGDQSVARANPLSLPFLKSSTESNSSDTVTDFAVCVAIKKFFYKLKTSVMVLLELRGDRL